MSRRPAGAGAAIPQNLVLFAALGALSAPAGLAAAQEPAMNAPAESFAAPGERLAASGESLPAPADPVPFDPRSLRDRHPSRREPLVAVLCYHDVSDNPSANVETVSPEALQNHIRRLRSQGWKFRTVSQVLSFRETWNRLPKKTAVLTFDDGYRSFLTEVLPILRQEKVPASLAVITAFVDAPPAMMPPLLTWDELREIQGSGLVEILSHSHALHLHDVANPQGLTAPAITTRLYLTDLSRYENRDEYSTRILTDLVRSREILKEKLGIDAQVLAWPYGEYNDAARRIAFQAGFTATVGLEGASVTAEDVRTGYLSRLLVTRDQEIGTSNLAWLFPPRRMIHSRDVDLDDLYDPDPERLVENVESMIRDLWDREATDVFLSVCADPTGVGYLEETYFMNHQIPVRADVWSMAAIRMKRAGFRVWARVPALDLTWAWVEHPQWRLDTAGNPEDSEFGRRPFLLSPELPEVLAAGVDFLNDVAVYLPLDGIAFESDARLGDGDRLRSAPDADESAKKEAMEGYLQRLEDAVLTWRPHAEFVRPEPVSDPVSSGSLRDGSVPPAGSGW